MSDKLSDCPFCRASASIYKIGRDWWELKAEHDDECALDSDHVLRAPQTPEGRAWLVTAWNRRPSPEPAITALTEKEFAAWFRSQDAFDRCAYFAYLHGTKAAPVIPESEDAREPVGDWLWRHLMDYCRERGIAPANNDRLFEIVKRAREQFDAARKMDAA